MQFKLSTITSLAILATALAAPTTSLNERDLEWTVTHFTRTPSVALSTVTYAFGIFTGAATQDCTIVDPTTDPVHSFFAVPCQEDNDFLISWGYNAEFDFTVMTVVYKPWELEAWFGYLHPNVGFPAAFSYKDQGPSAVQGTGA